MTHYSQRRLANIPREWVAHVRVAARGTAAGGTEAVTIRAPSKEAAVKKLLQQGYAEVLSIS